MTDVAFDRLDQVVLARVSGEIDIGCADRLEEAIVAAARAANDAGLVVDLSDVGFLDSAGIRLLFSIHRALTESGRPMAIVVPDGARIGSVLRIVDMPSVVWTAGTVDGAIGMLYPPGVGRQSSS